MRLVVNGEAQEVPAGVTVAEIVMALNADPSGSAVAVNGEVVPRSGWAARRLAEGDRVEVLTAVQGG